MASIKGLAINNNDIDLISKSEAEKKISDLFQVKTGKVNTASENIVLDVNEILQIGNIVSLNLQIHSTAELAANTRIIEIPEDFMPRRSLNFPMTTNSSTTVYNCYISTTTNTINTRNTTPATTLRIYVTYIQ